MVALSDVVRRITIFGRTEGVDQATASLHKLAGAQDQVGVATETTSRSTLSMQSRLNSIQRSLDVAYRNEEALTKVTRDLSVARSQGLITAQRENELLTLAAAKYDSAAAGTNKMAMGANRATEAFNALSIAFGTIAAAFSIQALIRYTDLWTDLNSRVANASGSIDAGAVVMGRLSDMARRTYSSLQQTAESYLSNATSLRELGYSTKQQLDLVESLNNALVVSGTKGERAASVMDAWSKAMALGKLQGDNLNTVIQSGGRVAEALAASLDVSTNQLRKLGAEGKITTDKMFGITSQLEKLRAEADAMPATISDALGQLGNSVLKTVGTFDKAVGGSTRMADAILFLADHMDVTIGVVAGLAGALMTLLLPAITATTLALLANPFFLVAAAIGVLVGALVQYNITASLAAQRATQFNEPIKNNAAALETAATASGAFRTNLKAQIEMQKISAETALKEASAQLAAAKARLTAQTVEHQSNPWNLVNAWQLGDTKRDVASGMDTTKALDQQLSTIEVQFAKAAELEKRLGGAKISPLSIEDKAGAKAAKAYSDMTLSARQFIDQQQREAQSLGMTREAASRLRHEQELLNKAANDNIKLTPAQRAELGGLAAQMAATEEQTRKLSEAYDFGKQTFGSFFSDLKSELMSGTSLWTSFANAASKALDAIANKALDMAANGIWDMIFKAFSGTMSGGFDPIGNGAGVNFSDITNFRTSANGNVFSGPGINAYSNSIVTRPTLFPFATGTGLMGEAGPEAIMPLRRGADGRLGIATANSNQPLTVNVQIIRKAGAAGESDSATATRNGNSIDVQALIIDTTAAAASTPGTSLNRSLRIGLGGTQQLTRR